MNTTKNTFSIVFYLRNDRIKKNGSAPIFCRITISGTLTAFNIHTDISPSLWDVKMNRAIGKSNEAIEVNNTLDNYLTSLKNTYRELVEKSGSVTAEQLKNKLLGLTRETEEPLYLLQLFSRHNNDMGALIGKSFSKAIYQKYKCVYSKLENFIKTKYNLSDIKLVSINHQFIVDFESYMRIYDNNGTNTVGRNMRLLKKIINMALNNGYIIKNPFANYKIKFEKTDRGCLDKNELQKIIDKNFSIDRLERVKDVFLFSCFTGLAYIDVHNLSYDDLRIGIDNQLWIINKRVKTGTNISVPLMDIPLAIVEKYRDKQKDNKVMPCISNHKLNTYLKEIADVCGINKDLTFHMARHTFATTVTLRNGVPITTVSKLLGHTKLSTTQIYARTTEEMISDDMSILSNKLNTYNNSYKR